MRLSLNMLTMWLLAVATTLELQATAQFSLSSPTGYDTQCYGEPATLFCKHFNLPQGQEYPQGDVHWTRDNESVTVDGLERKRVPIMNSTLTILNFTITPQTVGNYTCFLVNAIKGGKVESNSVTIRPLDQLLTPVNISTFSNSTTAVLTVSVDPQCCNTVQLNVNITANSSNATTHLALPVDSTDPTNTTIVITDITEGVFYTASIRSVCEDNNLLEDSEPLVVTFINNGEGPTIEDSLSNTILATALAISFVTILVICTCAIIVIVYLVLKKKNKDRKWCICPCNFNK